MSPDYARALHDLDTPPCRHTTRTRALRQALAQLDAALHDLEHAHAAGLAVSRTTFAVRARAQASRASAELEAIRSEIDGGAR